MKLKNSLVRPDNLNTGQRECVSLVADFLKSDKTSFTISGHAGTGKSYITKYIIQRLLQNKKVTVSAPTHKAVRVIEKFTGKKGHTLHSLHGLRPNYSLEDFNIDKIKFESIGNIKFNEYNVIFIDEASMINHDLKRLNDVRAKQYKTKLIYLGDAYQLPPVNENKPSDVFTDVDNKYILTEVVRQDKDNPLLDLFTILRSDIDTNRSDFLSYIYNNKSVIGNGGYRLLNLYEFKELIKELFTSDEFKSNIDFIRYAAYTNDSITYWNKFIRNLLFPRAELLVEGDILTGYKTIVDDNNTPIITNSTDYKVLKAEKRLSDDKFSSYYVDLVDLSSFNTVSVSIVDHTDKSFVNYYKILNNLHRIAYYAPSSERGAKYKNYFNFKNTHLSMVKFGLKDKSSNRERGWVDRELNYGYGITVHKLQGSTIENIALNGANICYYDDNSNTPRRNTLNNPNVISLRNRLLYTGLTRVSDIAYIYL